MNMDFNMYMNDVVSQARNEMRESGYTELTTPEEVDQHGPEHVLGPDPRVL